MLVRALMVAILFVLVAGAGQANERGSKADARALAERAADFVRTQGAEAAWSAFEDPEGPFWDRDLYVFVTSMDCTFLSHGLNPSLKGGNIWNLKNPSGRYACRDISELMKAEGKGWTRYIFKDPLSGKLAWKDSYSIKVGDFIISVGAYDRLVSD